MGRAIGLGCTRGGRQALCFAVTVLVGISMSSGHAVQLYGPGYADGQLVLGSLDRCGVRQPQAHRRSMFGGAERALRSRCVLSSRMIKHCLFSSSRFELLARSSPTDPSFPPTGCHALLDAVPAGGPVYVASQLDHDDVASEERLQDELLTDLILPLQKALGGVFKYDRMRRGVEGLPANAGRVTGGVLTCSMRL